jgi:hypothetical protein
VRPRRHFHGFAHGSPARGPDPWGASHDRSHRADPPPPLDHGGWRQAEVSQAGGPTARVRDGPCSASAGWQPRPQAKHGNLHQVPGGCPSLVRLPPPRPGVAFYELVNLTSFQQPHRTPNLCLAFCAFQEFSLSAAPANCRFVRFVYRAAVFGSLRRGRCRCRPGTHETGRARPFRPGCPRKHDCPNSPRLFSTK